MIAGGLSERGACGVLELRRKSYRYEPKERDTGTLIERIKGVGDEVSAIRVPAGMGDAETCGNGDQPPACISFVAMAGAGSGEKKAEEATPRRLGRHIAEGDQSEPDLDI